MEGELSALDLFGGELCRHADESRSQKVGDGDTGPNTDMGAMHQPRGSKSDMLARYEEEIVRPTLAGLKSEGVDFRGRDMSDLCLLLGPKVLEFNVFGVLRHR